MFKIIKKIIKALTGEVECFYITNGGALLPDKLKPNEEKEIIERIKIWKIFNIFLCYFLFEFC